MSTGLISILRLLLTKKMHFVSNSLKLNTAILYYLREAWMVNCHTWLAMQYCEIDASFSISILYGGLNGNGLFDISEWGHF